METSDIELRGKSNQIQENKSDTAKLVDSSTNKPKWSTLRIAISVLAGAAVVACTTALVIIFLQSNSDRHESGKSSSNNVIKDHYIVRLDSSMVDSPSKLQDFLANYASVSAEDFSVQNAYDALTYHGMPGFSAKLSKPMVSKLQERVGVLSIEHDTVVTVSSSCQTQTDATWGIARTNVRGEYDSQTSYSYTQGATGSNVNVYVVDTGVYCEHNEFKSKSTGTCRYGVDLVDGSNIDKNGHGTHVAGTVAGATYGVAKEANIISVRAFDSDGKGSMSSTINAINWIAGNKQSTNGMLTVAVFGITGDLSSSANSALAALKDSGVIAVVAAGNDGKNACSFSPGSEPSAITVAATTNEDKRADYSNYGECVDIFGPGSDILSAGISSPTATSTLSGTSMAAAHVAGVMAKLINSFPSYSVADITSKLKAIATVDEVSNESGSLFKSADKSPNLLAYADCFARPPTSFDWTTGTRALYHSESAYCSPDTYLTRTYTGQFNGFVATYYIVDEPTDTSGYIGYSTGDNSIYVSYRGSSSIQNWITNLDLIYEAYPYCDGCYVHQGFYEAESVVIDGVISEVKRLKTLYPSYRVIVTGHSLGAALAMLTSLDLIHSGVNDVELFNFGQPRAGNPAFVFYANQLLPIKNRITHHKDIVPKLPGDNFYAHGSYEWFQSGDDGLTDMTLVECYGLDDPECSISYTPGNIEDHLEYLGLVLGSDGCTALGF